MVENGRQILKRIQKHTKSLTIQTDFFYLRHDSDFLQAKFEALFFGFVDFYLLLHMRKLSINSLKVHEKKSL